eukprot:gene9174-19007_t
MGCGGSASKQLLDELEREKQDRLREKEEYQIALQGIEQKKYEQINLLRFKVEVLVQMLGIEESKQATLAKRIEALKWAMLAQGWSERSMDNMLKTLVASNDGSIEYKKKIELLSSCDLSTSISTTTEVINTSGDSFLRSFADDNGRILPVLSRNDFTQKLMKSSNGKISELDAQILSLRFFDGTMVSIAEFLDFFMSSQEVRKAKAATGAVRASLNMLQLEPTTDDGAPIERPNIIPSNRSSHAMKTLDNAIQHMINIWKYVEVPLKEKFNFNEKGMKIVSLEDFQDILITVCDSKSLFIPDAIRPSSALTRDDIDMIIERFEVAERVDCHSFLQFFDERARNINMHSGSGSGAGTGGSMKTFVQSPFQLSSEWAALRRDARLDTNTTDNTNGRGSRRSISGGRTGLSKGKKDPTGTTTMPTLTIPSDTSEGGDNNNNNSNTNTVPDPEESDSPLNVPLSKRNKKLSRSVQSEGDEGEKDRLDSILNKYSTDPEQFELELTYKFQVLRKTKITASMLKMTLREMCPNCSEKEAVDICDKIEMNPSIGCTAKEVIATLEALKRNAEALALMEKKDDKQIPIDGSLIPTVNTTIPNILKNYMDKTEYFERQLMIRSEDLENDSFSQ